MTTLVRIIPTTPTATTTPLAPLASLPTSTTSAISSTALVEDVAFLLALFVASLVAVSSEKSHLTIIFNVDRCIVDNLLLVQAIAVNCGYNRNEGEQTNDDANRTTCDHFDLPVQNGCRRGGHCSQHIKKKQAYQ